MKIILKTKERLEKARNSSSSNIDSKPVKNHPQLDETQKLAIFKIAAPFH